MPVFIASIWFIHSLCDVSLLPTTYCTVNIFDTLSRVLCINIECVLLDSHRMTGHFPKMTGLIALFAYTNIYLLQLHNLFQIFFFQQLKIEFIIQTFKIEILCEMSNISSIPPTYVCSFLILSLALLSRGEKLSAVSHSALISKNKRLLNKSEFLSYGQFMLSGLLLHFVYQKCALYALHANYKCSLNMMPFVFNRNESWYVFFFFFFEKQFKQNDNNNNNNKKTDISRFSS